MSSIKKIHLLGSSAKWDSCGMSKNADHSIPGICRVKYGEETCSLMKVLMSNRCIYNCKYCINRKKRNTLRDSFEPEELARIFMHYYERNWVEGLFLSSAVEKDPDFIMEKMIMTAKILREKYGYGGYLHLKVIPGASYYFVKEACKLATRTSINIETSKQRLNEISDKDFKYDIIRRFSWMKKLYLRGHVPAGYTTQFIVGAAGESDKEIVETLEILYKNFGIKKAYFSAFCPIKGTPLENKKSESPVREYRLYQVDYLMRKYNFSIKDIPFNEEGFLDLNFDPKYKYAVQNIGCVDINKAEKEELLKVPGIGPVSAERIIRLRRCGVIFKEMKDLQKLGISLKKALPFIKINDSQKRIFDYGGVENVCCA